MSVGDRSADMNAQKNIGILEENVRKVYLGDPEKVRLLVVALIAGGHVLIEDVPGVGKTILARALARSLDCGFRRIQFTPDMLPSDVLGVSLFENRTNQFVFKHGPIFTNVILADEINRTTPRTQSCLLEAMNDFRVSVDGVTYELELPFMVVATQNPFEFEGTYPLPESQLDRFMIRLSLGYPSTDNEKEVFTAQKDRHPIDSLCAVLGKEEVVELQAAVRAIRVDESIQDYVLRILEATRRHEDLYVGASPRGGIFLLRSSQALALCLGRQYVLPDDVKELVVPVLGHRLICRTHSAAETNFSEATRILEDILTSVPVPR